MQIWIVWTYMHLYIYCNSSRQGIQFDPWRQFDQLYRNCVLLCVSCTIWVKYKVSSIYFAANLFSFFPRKSRDHCALTPPYISLSLSQIATLYHPTHYVPPQWLWIPWIPPIFPPSMMRDTSWWIGISEIISSSPCTYWCIFPVHKGITGLVGFPLYE